VTDSLRLVQAVAFDLDGTLVDSAPDIQHALNAALKKAGLARFDLDAVRGWIGDGPDALIGRALAAQGLAEADDELRTRLRRWFDVDTLAAPLAAGAVYPGILDLVSGLHRMLPMVVVTNKPTPLARAVLDAAGVLPFVDAVFGADTAALRKPAPAMLLAAAQHLGIAAERLLMVGDSALDMQCAHAAGCRAVLVPWGYGHHTLPTGLDPLRVSGPDELLQVLLATRRTAEPLLNS
jgi:phosphoglycolate phosphatase